MATQERFVPFNAAMVPEVKKSGWGKGTDPLAKSLSDKIEAEAIQRRQGQEDELLLKSLKEEGLEGIVVEVLAKGAGGWTDEARASALAAKQAKNKGQDPKLAATIAKQQVAKGMTVGQAIDKTHEIMGKRDEAKATRDAQGKTGQVGLTDKDGNLSDVAQQNLNSHNRATDDGDSIHVKAGPDSVKAESYNNGSMDSEALHFDRDPGSAQWTASKVDTPYGIKDENGKNVKEGGKYTGEQVHNIVKTHALGVEKDMGPSF